MTERKIFVLNPQPNTSPNRRFSLASWENTSFPEYMKLYKIYPTTHPNAIDLASGDGPWAKRLIANGWETKNITCVDIAIPNPPVIEGLTWIYWDLEAFGDYLQHKGYGFEFPPEIEAYRGAFDVVTSSYAGRKGMGLRNGHLVSNFFAKEGALIWEDMGFIRVKKPISN